MPSNPALGDWHLSSLWNCEESNSSTIVPQPYADQVSKGGSLLRLNYPDPVRDDRALGDEVNKLLVAWADEMGIYAGRLEQFKTFDLGRLVMLTYADTDDPGRLMTAARCMAVSAAIDDDYIDAAGPRHLARVQAAFQPVRLRPGLVRDDARAGQDDPVLRAASSAVRHLERHGAASQVARFRHEINNSLLAKSQKAIWTARNFIPSVSEYMTHRQANGFMPWLALIDLVGGYELPDPLYKNPGVRNAMLLASSAATIINDLHSAEKEKTIHGIGLNLPALIAAEADCPLEEAIVRSISIHNNLLRSFEDASAACEPAAHKFLTRILAWIAGGNSWHSTSARYRTSMKEKDR